MSAIVTGILSSTVGLLWHKARETTAAKLKDGDVTDAKIRQIIVPELTDLKTKLEGLSRKDLRSSYHFLKEGAKLLNDSLDKSKLEQKLVLNETQVDRGEILNEALQLSHAMGKLKNNSNEEFEKAKKRFEEARIKATEAFCIDTLSIEERIFAAKLRIASELLECLERPETAISGCLSFLEELHSLPTIEDVFTVFLKGGFKSKLYKAEREENVKSVMLINYVLFRYVTKLSSKYSSDVLAWPTIKLADRRSCPILQWPEIAEKMSTSKEMTQHPNGLILDEEIDPPISAVNNRGDIVVEYRLNFNNIKVISRTGESKLVKLPDLKEDEVLIKDIKAIAVDNNNADLYVVRWLRILKQNRFVKSYVLTVFDENFNVKHDCTLDFIDAATDYHATVIAINGNNNIILIKYKDPHVYVCDDTGQLKHKFKRDSSYWLLSNLNISAAKNEIIILSVYGKAITIYTEEGNLMSTMQVPAGHEVLGMAFHYVICKIIVLTLKKDSYFLLLYSETGELETSKFLCNRNGNEWRPSITCHPSGPVAVVRQRSITFI